MSVSLTFLLFLLQLPGFLELIVEFYRRCLIQIFGILKEYEVGTVRQGSLLGPLPEEEVTEELLAAASESNGQTALEQKIQRWSAEQAEDMPPPLLMPSEEEVKEPVVKEEAQVKEEEHMEEAEACLQQASKYDKLPIRVETGDGWEEVEERWAKLNRPNGFISGLLHWKAGGGDSTTHILTHFESRTGDFVPLHPPEWEENAEGQEGETGKEELGGGEEQNQPDGGEGKT